MDPSLIAMVGDRLADVVGLAEVSGLRQRT
jgi:hypothetical protein